MKYSIAISTYFTKKIMEKGRLDIFKSSINSLLDSNFEGKIFIVDDGSETYFHLDYLKILNDKRVVIVEKKINSGVSKTKNTGIRLILENNFDYGFLSDDDILYQKNWFVPYLNVMDNTKVKHLSFYDKRWTPDISGVSKNSVMINYQGYNLELYENVQGGMLTFSKKMIETVGYFKIFPYKIGHEHSNFSYRCIRNGFSPGFADVEDSNKLLSYVDETGKITTREDDFRDKAKINEINLFSLNKEPCIE